MVVTRPSQERGLDAAIVVDQSAVALAWAQSIDELEATMRRSGAFRSLTRWSLDLSERTGSEEPLIRDIAGAAHRTDQLCDPAGRRLILVLTDGTHDRWRVGGVWQVLRRWSQAMPTTLVHLLPASYRGYTAIGQSTSIVRSVHPTDANAVLDTRSAWWCEDAYPYDVPIPVVNFDPLSILLWSRAIVNGSAWAEAVWARPPASLAEAPVGEALSAQDRVAIFEMRASEGAQMLARILAGTQVLSLPLIRVLHEHLIPGSETSQIAELLVSGLLERLPDNLDRNNALLRFRDGVGPILHQGTTITQEWDVYDLLTRYLERHTGPGDTVRALVADPEGGATTPGDLHPFAAMGKRTALRLGLDLDLDLSQAAATSRVAGASDSTVGITFDYPRRYLLLCTIGEFLYDFPSLQSEQETADVRELFSSLKYTVISIASGTAARMGDI